MPFVQGKCEACGGILTVDPSLKAANCPFCGSAYVIQDAINYYNTNIKIDSLHADVVNISDESSADGRIKAADAYMKLGKFEKAEDEYKKATEYAPQNYKGWLGMIEALTCNYSRRIKSASTLNTLSDYANSVKTFAPDEMKESILQKFESYAKNETEQNDIDVNSINQVLTKQTESWKDFDKQEKALTAELNQKRSQYDSLCNENNFYIKNNRNHAILTWGIILSAAGLFLIFMSIVMSISNGFTENSLTFLILGFFPLIPGSILIASLIQRNNNHQKRESEIGRLSVEQNEIYNQVAKITGQKNALYMEIQSNQKELSLYN